MIADRRAVELMVETLAGGAFPSDDDVLVFTTEGWQFKQVSELSTGPHTHDAADVVSGVFDLARIPSHTHTKSEITDFAHTHVAADITSGVFDAARIPSHDIVGSLHTTSGRTAGQFIRATAATTFGWSTLTLPNTATSGSLLYASSSNTIGALAIGSSGTVLRSTGAAPAWSTLAKADLPSAIAYEDEANTFTAIQTFNEDIRLAATQPLYFDGGTHTYIQELTNDNLVFVVGGATNMLLQTSLTTFSQVARFTSGSAGAPGIAFTSDTDTGLRLTGTNIGALVAGATEILEWHSTHLNTPGYYLSSGGFYSGSTNTGFNHQGTDFAVRVGGNENRLTVDTTGNAFIANNFRQNAGTRHYFDINTGGHTYIGEASNDLFRITVGGTDTADFSPGSMSVGGSLRAGQGTHGYVSLTTGGATQTGYIGWHAHTTGTRLGYMGWGTTALTLQLENSYHFQILGGDLELGSLGRFDSTDTPSDREFMVYNATDSRWRAETIQFTFGNSDIKNTINGDNSTFTYILNDPGAGADSPVGTPAVPVVKLYAAHKSITIHIVLDDTGAPYSKPADFRRFNVQVDDNSGFTSPNSVSITSDKIVVGRLTNSTTYYVRVNAEDRAGNTSAYSSTVSTTPTDSETSAFGVIIASEIGVVQLSAIAATIGDIVAGQIRNQANSVGFFIDTWPGASVPDGSWTRYISLIGSGSDKFIYHENFELWHNGLARLKTRMIDTSADATLGVVGKRTLQTHSITGGWYGNYGGWMLIIHFNISNANANATLSVEAGASGVIATKTFTTGTNPSGQVAVYCFGNNSTTLHNAFAHWSYQTGAGLAKNENTSASGLLGINSANDHDIRVCGTIGNTGDTVTVSFSWLEILPKD